MKLLILYVMSILGGHSDNFELSVEDAVICVVASYTAGRSYVCDWEAENEYA